MTLCGKVIIKFIFIRNAMNMQQFHTLFSEMFFKSRGIKS